MALPKTLDGLGAEKRDQRDNCCCYQHCQERDP